MEIQGKVIYKSDHETIDGKNGTMTKQTLVIETEGQYPEKVAFENWNDKANTNDIWINHNVRVSFSPKSRENNGRWFTSLIMWKIQKV